MDEIILTERIFDEAEHRLRDRLNVVESLEEESNVYSHLDLLWDAPLNAPVSSDLRETLEMLGMID